MTASALDISRIRAITLDLDDTLWPIWPTIARAEAVLLDWLAEHAPATRALHASTAALRALRDRVQLLRPELSCDLGALRRESIRMALQQAGDPPQLAEPAFEVFLAERQRVDLIDDALAVLEDGLVGDAQAGGGVTQADGLFHDRSLPHGRLCRTCG